jgi:DNA-binding XRE family transcriptional regulator
MTTVLVKNADRMMTSAHQSGEGIEVTFADGAHGIVPLADIPEIGSAERLASLDLPNLYMLVLRTNEGVNAEVPWDVARHYCDETYRQRVEEVGTAGRLAMGQRIRDLREKGRLSQERLAKRAGVGRVTLVRVERGEQSPRYDTLASLAKALGVSVGELLRSS